MDSQINITMYFLLASVSCFGIAILVAIVLPALERNFFEILLRVIAMIAGILLVAATAAITGILPPALYTEAIRSANTFSAEIYFYALILPTILGLAFAFYLKKTIEKGHHLHYRIIILVSTMIIFSLVVSLDTIEIRKTDITLSVAKSAYPIEEYAQDHKIETVSWYKSKFFGGKTLEFKNYTPDAHHNYHTFISEVYLPNLIANKPSDREIAQEMKALIPSISFFTSLFLYLLFSISSTRTKHIRH